MWLDLAHVCRNWRAITYASPSRLHLGITVGPIKPVHIKTILASHQALPILLDFKYMLRDMTASAIWRMNYALKHRDRVHNIVFEGTGAGFDKFFKATNCAFPVLEGVTLYFNYGYRANIPYTFLRGPDLSDLHLRRLRLDGVSLAFISGFLSSATSLTDLFLRIDTVSSEMSLLFCLRGMTCLRRLDLTITSSLLESSSQSSSSTPKVVLFSRLAYFRYVGPSRYLDALVAKLSAPSLQDIDLNFYDGIWPSEHLPRFINEIRECYHAAHVIFEQAGFHLSMLTQSEYISHFKSHSVILGSRDKFPESLTRLSSALSTKLTTVEELHVFLARRSPLPQKIIPCGVGSINTFPMSRRSGQKAQIVPTTWRAPFVETTESVLTVASCPLWKKSTSARNH